MDDLVRRLRLHGAELVCEAEVQLAPAPADGARIVGTAVEQVLVGAVSHSLRLKGRVTCGATVNR